MRIIVTNDDGFESDGIEVLRAAASEIGDVYTVAPRKNHSGASHALTLRDDVTVERLRERFYVVDGTPTDCSRLAYSGWLGFEPDWIISGINRGANLSDDVLYSGTVAAATEGRFLKYVPVAFSLATEPPYDFEAVRQVCVDVLKAAAQCSLPAGTVLNVNIPKPARSKPVYRATRLADRTGVARPEKLAEISVGGRRAFKLPVPPPDVAYGDDTDLHAINDGVVSITPLAPHSLRDLHIPSVRLEGLLKAIGS